MVTVRCTRNLLEYLAAPLKGDIRPSTTLLGDWYANVLDVSPEPLVLCISERSLLPVVFPAGDPATFGLRLRVSVGYMLEAIHVPIRVIEDELAEMVSVSFGPTNNRRFLGTANEFMYHLDRMVDEQPHLSHQGMALRIATIPSKPIQYRFPKEAARELLRETKSRRRSDR